MCSAQGKIGGGKEKTKRKGREGRGKTGSAEAGKERRGGLEVKRSQERTKGSIT